jgi:hypothetical protein
MEAKTVLNVPSIDFDGGAYYKQPVPWTMALLYYVAFMAVSFILGFIIQVISGNMGYVKGISEILAYVNTGITWISVIVTIVYFCSKKPIKFYKTKSLIYEIVPQLCIESPCDWLCCRPKMEVHLDGKQLGYIRKARCCENGCMYECGCYEPPGCCEGANPCGICACYGQGILAAGFIGITAACVAVTLFLGPEGVGLIVFVALVLLVCIYPCYKCGKDGRKITMQKVFVFEDPEAGGKMVDFGATPTYTIRRSAKCCCIEIIEWCVTRYMIAIGGFFCVVVEVGLFELIDSNIMVMAHLIIGVLVGCVSLVYAVYQCIVNQKRYMHLKQDLYGPKGDEAPEAEVNWIKCSKDTLAYSAGSEQCKKPGHAGVAHQGVLSAVGIIYEDDKSWPAANPKLQVQHERYFFRSINGLKVAYNEDNPEVEGSQAGARK